MDETGGGSFATANGDKAPMSDDIEIRQVRAGTQLPGDPLAADLG